MNVSKNALAIVLALAFPVFSSSKVIEPERAQGGFDDHGVVKTGSGTFLRRMVEQPDATVDGVDIVVDSLNSPDTDIVAAVAVVDGRQRKHRRLHYNYVPVLGNFLYDHNNQTVGKFFTFERPDWEWIFGTFFDASFTTGNVTVCNSDGGRKVTQLEIWDRDSEADKGVFTWVDNEWVDTEEGDFWGIYGRTTGNQVNFNKPDVRIYSGITSCPDKYSSIARCDNPGITPVIGKGDTFVFKRKGNGDRICSDDDGNEYSYGAVILADDENAEVCARECAIAHGTESPAYLVGYDWKCNDSTCHCLYNDIYLNDDIESNLIMQWGFDSYNSSNLGSGSIEKTTKKSDWQCYRLDETISTGN